MRFQNKNKATFPRLSEKFTLLFFHFKKIKLGIFLCLFLIPAFVQAIDNPVTANSFPELISKIIEGIVIPVGTVIAVLAVIYSGFLFVTAQGNTEQLSKARSAFMWAVIGGLILIGSLAISKGICNTVNEIVEEDLEC